MPMLLPACLFVAVLGVVVALFLHRRNLLREVLVTVSRRAGGRVVKGPMGIYPLAKIPLEGEQQLLLSGIQGGKTRATCTFAWIGCRTYGETHFELRRKPARAGILERMGRRELETGHKRIDEAFWLVSGEQDTACEFLTGEVRELLMGFDPELRMRLRVGTVVAFPDGWRTGETEPSLEIALHKLPASVADVERMVDLARVAHAQLAHERGARAA